MHVVPHIYVRTCHNVYALWEFSLVTCMSMRMYKHIQKTTIGSNCWPMTTLHDGRSRNYTQNIISFTRVQQQQYIQYQPQNSQPLTGLKFAVTGQAPPHLEDPPISFEISHSMVLWWSPQDCGRYIVCVWPAKGQDQHLHSHLAGSLH